MSAMLLYGWLRVGLAIPVRVATGAAVLFTLEPAQVFYERMVMAEATGLLALAAFFACASALLAHRVVPLSASLALVRAGEPGGAVLHACRKAPGDIAGRTLTRYRACRIVGLMQPPFSVQGRVCERPNNAR